MRLFQTQHLFEYPWSLVSAANWQKYPNESCPHVVAVDVLDRHLDPDTGVLTTERLLTLRQNVPHIILRMIGESKTQFVREISILDPRNRTVTLQSRNLTCANLVVCDETVTYAQHPREEGKTVFTQEAYISSGSSLSRVSSYIEDFSIQRFRENAAVGRAGFEKVLERFAV